MPALYENRVNPGGEPGIYVTKWTETANIDLVIDSRRMLAHHTFSPTEASRLGWALISAASALDEKPDEKLAEVIDFAIDHRGKR